MNGDVAEITARPIDIGIPFKINKTKSYIWIDTDAVRLEFTPRGEMRKCAPRQADLRRKNA
jgi:hypothetical protein